MNNKGFVLAWLSILLVVLIGALSSMSSLLIIQWNKQKQINFCRSELKRVQQFVSAQAHVLLSLNPTAMQLRIELALVEKQILVALAAGQLPLVKALKLKRLSIRLKQRKLDQYQNSIIKITHSKSKLMLRSLHTELKTRLDQSHRLLGQWGKGTNYLAHVPASRFAFKPNDRALAPIYSPYKSFESSQSMAFSWIEYYQWSSWQKMFTFPNQIKSQCRLSLKEGTWLPIVQRDRL